MLKQNQIICNRIISHSWRLCKILGFSMSKNIKGIELKPRSFTFIVGFEKKIGEDSIDKIVRSIDKNNIFSKKARKVQQETGCTFTEEMSNEHLLIKAGGLSARLEPKKISNLVKILFSSIKLIEFFSFETIAKVEDIDKKTENKIKKKYLKASAPFDSQIEARLRTMQHLDFKKCKYNLFTTFDIVERRMYSQEDTSDFDIQKDIYLMTQINDRYPNTKKCVYDQEYIRGLISKFNSMSKSIFNKIVE